MVGWWRGKQASVPAVPLTLPQRSQQRGDAARIVPSVKDMNRVRPISPWPSPAPGPSASIPVCLLWLALLFWCWTPRTNATPRHHRMPLPKRWLIVHGRGRRSSLVGAKRSWTRFEEPCDLLVLLLAERWNLARLHCPGCGTAAPPWGLHRCLVPCPYPRYPLYSVSPAPFSGYETSARNRSRPTNDTTECRVGGAGCISSSDISPQQQHTLTYLTVSWVSGLGRGLMQAQARRPWCRCSSGSGSGPDLWVGRWARTSWYCCMYLSLSLAIVGGVRVVDG